MRRPQENPIAKGLECPECGRSMHVQDERADVGGAVVTYMCGNGACASVQRGFPAKEEVLEPCRPAGPDAGPNDET